MILPDATRAAAEARILAALVARAGFPAVVEQVPAAPRAEVAAPVVELAPVLNPAARCPENCDSSDVAPACCGKFCGSRDAEARRLQQIAF